jgi:pseudaminic acid cytidylyltransferase
VPARGGSKRIPHKNIRSFCGRPIIAYSIEVAIACELFDEIMVSTDDEEIAILVKNLGAKVPFMRSPSSSNDYATLTDVLLEVLGKYSTSGTEFDIVCCILATAPFVSAKDLISGYNELIAGDYDAVVPLVQYEYPVQRALWWREGTVQFADTRFRYSRSQDLEIAYHDAGLFYWIRTSRFLRQRTVFMAVTGGLSVDPRYAQDLDRPEDWEMAEMKYRIMNGI